MGLIKGNDVKFSTELAVSEDVDFVLKVTQHTDSVALIDEAVYHYCYSANSAVRAFRSDYADRYIHAMQIVRSDISELLSSSNVALTFDSFVTYHLMTIIINYVFHPNAPFEGAKRKIVYKQLLANPVFHESLKQCRYKDFGRARKMFLFCYTGLEQNSR